MEPEFRGFERSALVKTYSGLIVAEVFTTSEPGDQYTMAQLFSAAPDLLAVLQSIMASEIELLRQFTPRQMHAALAAIARATGGKQ